MQCNVSKSQGVEAISYATLLKVKNLERFHGHTTISMLAVDSVSTSSTVTCLCLQSRFEGELQSWRARATTISIAEYPIATVLREQLGNNHMHTSSAKNHNVTTKDKVILLQLELKAEAEETDQRQDLAIAIAQTNTK
jgi:hypothetical protein